MRVVQEIAAERLVEPEVSGSKWRFEIRPVRQSVMWRARISEYPGQIQKFPAKITHPAPHPHLTSESPWTDRQPVCAMVISCVWGRMCGY